MPQPPWRCLIVLIALTACTVYTTPRVSEVPRPALTDSILVSTPVKAHLLDGSTVVFPAGLWVVHGAMKSWVGGAASFRYGLTLRDSTPAGELPLDSVLAFETFRNSVNTSASVALSVLGTAGTAVAAAALAVAIFGSCPTFYSDSVDSTVLEAEGFSYSIAPRFEARDVDWLRATPDSTGALRLEVRNEALETHYINQLSVVQVSRSQSETVVPAQSGEPLALRDFVPPAAARDRTGRDVRADLAESDGQTFSSAAVVLDRATAEDATDAIDLTFPRSAGRDTAVLVFRMRNSLLNAVLLYELMLGDPGLRSLDWVGRDLQRVGPAARLAKWYFRHFGMRVAVRDGGQLRQIGRVSDTGPVAWKDVALAVPVPRGADSVRVRLTFVADNWRIDQVSLARDWRRLASLVLAPVSVTEAVGQSDTAMLASLRDADERYLVTQPGTRFVLHFAPHPTPAESVPAFLLVSQGYYIEWLRASWVQPHLTGAAFKPTGDAIVQALRRWRREAPDLERRFHASQIPVR
jgi:hypothetical protein